MKKLFFVFAIAATLVACETGSAKTETTTTDSTAVTVDTTAATVDTTAATPAVEAK